MRKDKAEASTKTLGQEYAERVQRSAQTSTDGLHLCAQRRGPVWGLGDYFEIKALV